jgi:ubiquinone/menaquinone biosynthesis C-methylase UbiE
VDFYDPSRMKQHSIERARKGLQYSGAEKRADFRALPFQDASRDAVFLILAAHEIRDQQDRIRFFAEVRRILKPGGRLILVEHLRDIWNFAAYGPGVRHFFPRREWLRTVEASNLVVIDERSITPFVRCFVLERGCE